jgi:glucose/arabinose dehydrogenase
MHEKKLLRAGLPAVALTFLALAAPARAQELSVQLVASGFAAPLWVGSPPGDFERLFVVEQNTALVRIIKNGQILPTPFLDVGTLASSGGERGLLSIAFHPDYANNGRFFIHYTDNNGDSRVVEYAVSGDPDVANPTAVQPILSLDQPFANHNGGNLVFGPDGKLYIGFGDGGSQNDPGNRAQDGTTNLGKMLRLDIDIPSPFIPADNPFVNDPNVNDEIWAIGTRNPWRYSFDGLTGDLYIGDVGQDSWEEVDFQPAASVGGENYGWRCMEGTHCTGFTGCTCNDSSLTLPIHEFGHGGGNCSVTGGFVYRGSAIPWLYGTYIFGDYCSSKIWSFRYENGQVQEFTDRTAELEPAGSLTINSITSFGQDAAGELYIVDPSGGEIYKIIASCEATSYCFANPNSTGFPAVIGNSGSLSVAANDLVLNASSCPPNQFGLFFYGPEQIDVPFGNGHLCVGPGTLGLFRLNPPLQVDSVGDAIRPVDYTVPPMNGGDGQITPGSTWNFQFWYRDPMGGGAAFNTSDARSILFCP